MTKIKANADKDLGPEFSRLGNREKARQLMDGLHIDMAESTDRLLSAVYFSNLAVCDQLEQLNRELKSWDADNP